MEESPNANDIYNIKTHLKQQILNKSPRLDLAIPNYPY